METLHQVTAITGNHADNNLFDRDIRLAETRCQYLQTICLMNQIIHQDHRTFKGLDHLDLTLQRGIERERFNGVGSQIRLINLIGMECLCYGIRNNFTAQDLTKRHTHIAAETSRYQRLLRNFVQRRNAVYQTMMHDAG